MKTEFKAKFLQHVAKKRKEEGFTLIELLVVIIIIGILSAIALPSFLNQANKAKQSEAKQYIASLNKGQQAFFVENNAFTAEVAALGLGIKTSTQNYTYSIGTSTQLNGGDAATAVTSGAASGLATYGGAVYLVASGGGNTSESVICENTNITSQVTTFEQENCTTGGDGWKDL
jgi:prepilin-type N-terminal cleavage/methylation domain-containing protein